MRERITWAMKPDDGLGGDAGVGTQVPAGDTDPILEEPGYLSEGGEFEPDPGNTIGGTGDADPFAGFSEEVRREAEKKGWKDPNDMFKAYDGAKSLIGRRDEERDRLQQERDQLMAELQQRQQQQGPAAAQAPGADQGWTLDFEALETAAGGDPREMMRLYHENVVPELLKDFGQHILGAVDQNVGARMAPVEQYTTQATLKDQATQLARDFPQDFPKHREEIVRLVQARPEYQRSATGLQQAFYEILATERAREQAAARGQEGETLMGGMSPRGGAKRPQRDVAAETRAAIEGAIGSVQDGLSL